MVLLRKIEENNFLSIFFSTNRSRKQMVTDVPRTYQSNVFQFARKALMRVQLFQSTTQTDVS